MNSEKVMLSPEVKRYNFLPNQFPIIIEAFHPVTRFVVWSATIDEPEDCVLFHIPPLKIMLGHSVMIRIRFGDGTVEEE